MSLASDPEDLRSFSLECGRVDELPMKNLLNTMTKHKNLNSLSIRIVSSKFTNAIMATFEDILVQFVELTCLVLEFKGNYSLTTKATAFSDEGIKYVANAISELKKLSTVELYLEK